MPFTFTLVDYLLIGLIYVFAGLISTILKNNKKFITPMTFALMYINYITFRAFHVIHL